MGKISAQPHLTLCIQFLNRENNDKNNTFPLGKQICFTIVWGCAETLPSNDLFGHLRVIHCKLGCSGLFKTNGTLVFIAKLTLLASRSKKLPRRHRSHVVFQKDSTEKFANPRIRSTAVMD